MLNHQHTPWKIILAVFIILVVLSACSINSYLETSTPVPANTSTLTSVPTQVSTVTPASTATLTLVDPISNQTSTALAYVPTTTATVLSWDSITPTPDFPRLMPTLRAVSEEYEVKRGDTLNLIARSFNTSVDAIAEANQLENINILDVGQKLVIPAPNPQAKAPNTKIIPDSELVFGPSTVDFDIDAFIQNQGGYLSRYEEDIDEVLLTSAQIVERISRQYSVNPRLLLALLEYQSGWVTHTDPQPYTLDFPLHNFSVGRKGLHQQLTWAANELNRGYYLWRINALPAISLADGTLVLMDATINAGTSGVQNFFAQLHELRDWEEAISPDGLLDTFTRLFGSPFALAVEPLSPPDLVQPVMQLPFEPGKVWRYTGGPHGGWGNGSAWAALDFAPPGEALGCVISEEWVVAVADGLIVRSEDGHVIQDLSGDGFEQTGWIVFYLHIETRDRVEAGVYLQSGERVGHPSCEGGYSTGTHVHIARRYNGEWIPADQNLPFVMDGWVPGSYARPYYGYMIREGHRVEAMTGRHLENAIQRD